MLFLPDWIDLAKYYPIIIERGEKVCRKIKRLQVSPITIVYTLQNIKFKTFNVFHIPNNMSYATEARILKTESIAINVSHKF